MPPDEADLRVTGIDGPGARGRETITTAGRVGLRRGAPVYLAGIDEHVTLYLSAEEQHTIVEGLQRVIDANDAQADPHR